MSVCCGNYVAEEVRLPPPGCRNLVCRDGLATSTGTPVLPDNNPPMVFFAAWTTGHLKKRCPSSSSSPVLYILHAFFVPFSLRGRGHVEDQTPYLYHEPNEHFGRTITEANSLAHYNKHITITEANSLVHYNKHITTTEANSLAHYNKRITTTEANSLAHYNKRITITEANSLAHDNKRITTTEANSLAHYNKRITITSLRFRLPPVSFFLCCNFISFHFASCKSNYEDNGDIVPTPGHGFFSLSSACLMHRYRVTCHALQYKKS
nr:hypothetical protein BgiMline_032111 [Biomphalaria glabrata]